MAASVSALASGKKSTIFFSVPFPNEVLVTTHACNSLANVACKGTQRNEMLIIQSEVSHQDDGRSCILYF